MANQIKGRLKSVGLPQRGSTGKKAWVKVDFIITEEGTYPKDICMTAWGVTAEEIMTWDIGDVLCVNVSIESREYQNRWYTNIIAVKAFNSYK
jgi:hypothetical protein